MSNEANSMTIEALHDALEGVGASVANDLRNMEKDVTRLTAMDSTMRAILKTIAICDGDEKGTQKAVRAVGCSDYDVLSTVNHLIHSLQRTTQRLEVLQKNLHEND